MIKYLLFYLLIVNLLGFYFMYDDKEKAKSGQYRIKESTLWKIALAGGAIGSTAGMKLFHHKTKHHPFKIGMPTLGAIQLLVLVFLLLL